MRKCPNNYIHTVKYKKYSSSQWITILLLILCFWKYYCWSKYSNFSCFVRKFWFILFFLLHIISKCSLSYNNNMYQPSNSRDSSMLPGFFKDSCLQAWTLFLTIVANSKIRAYGAGNVLLLINSSRSSSPPSSSINLQYLALEKGFLFLFF